MLPSVMIGVGDSLCLSFCLAKCGPEIVCFRLVVMCRLVTYHGRFVNTIGAQNGTKQYTLIALAQLICVKITKPSLYKANPFTCSHANRDKPVASTIQRKCSGGILLIISTKVLQKKMSLVPA